MAIATLTVDIEARLARLEEGLSQVSRINQKAARDVESHWQTAGTAVKSALAPLAALFTADFLKNFVIGNAKAVESLNDISAATGSTVENISALQDVARSAGKDISVAETSLIKLNLALNNAKPGSEAAAAFTALGLSVEKLKRLDPAEALRQTAVALRGFADDGNKARLVMELTGKSMAEVAPFLKDLAEQGQLNASVSKEQADQAERFVRVLGTYETHATRAREALVLKLLPALTEIIAAFNAEVTPGKGIIAALDKLGNIAFDWENSQNRKQLRVLTDDLANLEARASVAGKSFLDRLEKLGGAGAVSSAGDTESSLSGQIAAKKKEIDSLVNALIDGQRKAREAIGNMEGLPLKSVGDPAAMAAAAKAQADALKLMWKQVFGTIDQAQEDELERTKAWLKGHEELNKQTTDAEALMWRQIFENIDREREAHDERERVAAGIGLDKKQVDEMTEFAKQAARNIQDALGTTLKNTLRGDFKSIGELWRNLLIDMAAEAAALQLNQFLFGKDKENPFLGGAIGAGLKLLSLDVGTPFVPRDGIAMLHRGEAVIPANQNRGGSGFTFNQTVNVGSGVSRNDVALAMNIARQQTKADIADAMRRGSPVFS